MEGAVLREKGSDHRGRRKNTPEVTEIRLRTEAMAYHEERGLIK